MKLLAVSMGDPAGIGPDIILKAWLELQKSTSSQAFIYIHGLTSVFKERAQSLGLDIPIYEIASCAEIDLDRTALPIIPLPNDLPPVTPGQLNHQLAPAIIASIDLCVNDALKGYAHGIVTAPIHKDNLYQAGFKYPGHTEYLEALSHRQGFEAASIMMMAAPQMRIVPLTIHVALKDVPQMITQTRIKETCRVLEEGLKHQFNISDPHIGVTGLNPHAGENGSMGLEEIDIIAPAIHSLQNEGMNISGPYPADTLFHEGNRGRFDAILAMYHDQALLPAKTVSFHQTVNVTLGLPFIRTSPDHGVALDLAGTGQAHPESFLSALRLAAQLSPPEMTPSQKKGSQDGAN